jgi:DNA-binding transcriptional regulator LsrR (DeoR family)
LRPQRDPEQLAKVAQMYFVEERSQDEIAAVFGTTGSNVSRMLKQARELGLVRVQIEFPTRRHEQLEQELQQRFELADARVLAIGAGADPQPGVGRLAARWLRDTLQDGQILGLSWGTTLQAVAQAMDGGPQRDVEIVQLMGGLSSIALASTGQELARAFAERLGARHHYLHAPALFASAERLATMLDEPLIRTALETARQADVALVGIGTARRGSFIALIQEFELSPGERRQLQTSGAAGDLCGRFYDLSGTEVRTPVADRVLAIGLDDLRRIPTVAAVAASREKASGILGALRGHLINVLVCDEHAAQAVLEIDSARQRGA